MEGTSSCSSQLTADVVGVLIAGAQPSAGAFSFQGTLYSALITGTLEHVCGSKYSDLEVTRKTLVLIHSKCRGQGGEQREEAEKLSR